MKSKSSSNQPFSQVEEVSFISTQSNSELAESIHSSLLRLSTVAGKYVERTDLSQEDIRPESMYHMLLFHCMGLTGLPQCYSHFFSTVVVVLSNAPKVLMGLQ